MTNKTIYVISFCTCTYKLHIPILEYSIFTIYNIAVYDVHHDNIWYAYYYFTNYDDSLFSFSEFREI